MYGYHGKILRVDLSKRELRETEVKEELYKKFIGGSGLAARMLNDFLRPGVDPLGPENPIAFMVGPFTGTPVPSSTRYALCALSPLTGIWGEATSGGTFPMSLKRAGYDGLIVTGRADEPVFLYVNDGEGEIESAEHLWGKDTYETQEILSKDLGEKKVHIACIGQAGEKLVKFANVMNDTGRAAGRCGLGAVMGSKNLKAIVAQGDQTIEYARPEELKEVAKDVTTLVLKNPLGAGMARYGTLAYIDLGLFLGDVPTKYFSESLFPGDALAPAKLMEKYVVESEPCAGCTVMCGKRIKFNKKGMEEVDAPEYETTAAFGPLCLNYDLDSVIRAGHLCNSFGMDTISMGVVISFSMYLFEKGVLKKEKIGFNLNWGDSDTILKLVEMTAKREGLGDELAEGLKSFGESLGVSRGEMAHVKGLEIPMHDPRAFFGCVVSYGTSSRGACHLRPQAPIVGLGVPYPEIGIGMIKRNQDEGTGQAYAILQNYEELFDSLLLCKYTYAMPFLVLDPLNAITGWNLDTEEMMKIGERNVNLKRIINCRLGVTAKDDRLPRLVLDPLEEGSTRGYSPDQDKILREYYEAKKWDPENGRPTQEKLEELGISNL